MFFASGVTRLIVTLWCHSIHLIFQFLMWTNEKWDLMLYASNIMKTRLFKSVENFTTRKGKFSHKKSDIVFSYSCKKRNIVGTR